jgi:hypothetical protein
MVPSTPPSLSAPTSAPSAGAVARIPWLHVTDLYHPAQDPDDHLDLLTLVALPELDLRGVILDATRRFLEPAPAGWDLARDPGYIPVAQLAHLTGRAIPAAMGPLEPMSRLGDTLAERPRAEQAGIELMLDTLRQSPNPMTISVVGSCRVPAAAFNREPGLMREKVRVLLLNAGSISGSKREWNDALDPVAYETLWRSGLPIDWYPCATAPSAFDRAHERGTHWNATHAALFAELPAALRGWVGYALTGSARSDLIRALAEGGRGAVWEQVLAGTRSLWSTASLVMAAGRVLARTDEGWRFLPEEKAVGLESWPWRLDPIQVQVDAGAPIEWQLAERPTGVRLFGRQPGIEYGTAMAEALNALFRSVPV